MVGHSSNQSNGSSTGTGSTLHKKRYNHGAATFEFENHDWEAYIRGRPAYPPALYKAIFRYHRRYGGKTRWPWTPGRFRTAVDIGAGVGIVTAPLLRKFRHVTLTDPAPGYVAQARGVFAHVGAEKLTFAAGKAEDLTRADLPGERPVDLITAATCLHWADLRVAIPALAGLLRRGGSLAAWLYGMPRAFGEEVPVAVRTAMARLVDRMAELHGQLVDQTAEDCMQAVMNAHFDSMDFDPAVWRDVQRWHANYDTPMVSADPKWPRAPSRVRPGERVRHFKDQQIIHKDMDYAEVVEWLRSINPEKFVPETLGVELAEVEKALAGKRVRFVFPFVLVLATKR